MMLEETKGENRKGKKQLLSEVNNAGGAVKQPAESKMATQGDNQQRVEDSEEERYMPGTMPDEKIIEQGTPVANIYEDDAN